MGFRKDAYRFGQQQDRFGKTVIVTDNMDWTTADIVSASLDRWQVEEQFRKSKNDDLVGVSQSAIGLTTKSVVTYSLVWLP